MKNQWTNFYNGYVEIKLSGILIEHFINRCIKEKIMIWEIKRQGNDSVSCYVHLTDVKRIRTFTKEYDIKLSFSKRKGIPFLYKRLLSNSGVFFGLVSALMIIFLLSNMVWNIKVEGASPQVEHEIRKELTEMGIAKGKFHFLLPNVSDIQRELSERVDMITWVGVDLQGTSYQLQIVEKVLPEEKELFSPRHLVAKKKGIIYDFFVEKGQPIIELNELVNKGDILVSGVMGEEERTEIVAAQGKVFAEIWYKSTVHVPLKSTFEMLSGESKHKHYLNFFGYSIPIWGFGEVPFKEFQEEREWRQIKFLKWNSPFTYEKAVFREKERVVRKYNFNEAKKVALKTAKAQLKETLPDDSTIKGQKVLHEKNENGKVMLQIQFQTIEDIASAQPIIQGD